MSRSQGQTGVAAPVAEWDSAILTGMVGTQGYSSVGGLLPLLFFFCHLFYRSVVDLQYCVHFFSAAA